MQSRMGVVCGSCVWEFCVYSEKKDLKESVGVSDANRVKRNIGTSLPPIQYHTSFHFYVSVMYDLYVISTIYCTKIAS